MTVQTGLAPTHTLTITRRADSMAVTVSDEHGEVVDRSPWLPAPICQDVLLRYVDELTAEWLVREATSKRTVRVAGPDAPALGLRAARAAAHPPGTFTLSSIETLVKAALVVGALAVVSSLAWLVSAIV